MSYIVTIDAGNTNVVFGIFDGDKYLGKWRIESREGRSADEYSAWLLTICGNENIDLSKVNGVIMACVVPAMELVLISMCRRFFKTDPLVVAPGIKTGMQISYGRAGDLSPDRLANIVATSHFYNSPSITFDFGTTTSLDVINEDGKYVGGILAPGVELALSTLSNTAPSLPGAAPIKPTKIIGTNIIHSMQSGCFWGTMDMVEGLARRIWYELGINGGFCIATGGYAQAMAEGTEIFHKIDTDLTLKGLKRIYDHNIK